MKIAIVTLPLISNFGGILQNFALQHCLKSMGHQPYTIDLDQSPSLIRYIARCLYLTLINKRITFADTYKRNPAIESFLERNIQLTDRVKKYSNNDSLRKYDAYVVGSDQVWRFTNSKYEIEDVYLNFTDGLNCNRIAYAVSFGDAKWNYPENITKKCRELVSSFDAVSVRESSAIELCKENLGITPIQVLDPTLLVDKVVYLRLCEMITPRKGLLVAYILDSNPYKISMVTHFADSKGLKPVVISESRKGGITVEDWLAYYRDADFIITDSFHGTAFSIIMEKEFVSISNAKRGNDRFISLLGQLGLIGRLINEGDEIGELPEINWDEVNTRKADKRIQSINFILNGLQ